MPLFVFLAEIFPGLAALALGAGGYGWLKHLKKRSHERSAENSTDR